MEITLGYIMQKMETELFSENDLERYRKREETLKTFIDVIFRHCMQLVKLPHKENSKIPFYKEQRIKRSLKRFSDYTEYLAME